ncbi:hypothetical protein AVEN_67433-1 [Araneus ventricosus]|uniref:Uncharacterized protein n=1 Tax=Araneus ventricosus TaxID=182803 RepID=A0A4Y2SF38_ARAVE|nr:hypothetical protein AVEN_67433-1 [Araneus ventricosus]
MTGRTAGGRGNRGNFLLGRPCTWLDKVLLLMILYGVAYTFARSSNRPLVRMEYFDSGSRQNVESTFPEKYWWCFRLERTLFPGMDSWFLNLDRHCTLMTGRTAGGWGDQGNSLLGRLRTWLDKVLLFMIGYGVPYTFCLFIYILFIQDLKSF